MIIVLCGGLVAVADYTEVFSVKRVITTVDSPGEPFSSNCLRKGGASRPLTASNTFRVTVCNFDQNYPLDYSDQEIPYDLTAELFIKYKGTDYTLDAFGALGTDVIPADKRDKYLNKAINYTIQKGNGDVRNLYNDRSQETVDNNGVTITKNWVKFSGSILEKNQSSMDIYTVTVDAADTDNSKPEDEDALFYVQVIATPDKEVVPFSVLSANLYGTKAKESKAAWVGGFQESDTGRDFFNYVIVGSGKATLAFSWNTSKLNMNEFFLEMNGYKPDDIVDEQQQPTGWKKITIDVDSWAENGKGRYEFQMYKATPDIEFTDLDDLKKYVKFEIISHNSAFVYSII